MPPKHDPDMLPRDKLLVLYQRLMLEDRRHYQRDLAAELRCSPQTVARLIGIIERHLGRDATVESGLEGKRRYYRLQSAAQRHGLGFSFEELTYLATCRDLAAQYLPESVVNRISRSLTDMALQLGEQSIPGQGIGFRSKGFIDYTPHLGTIGTLRQAIEKRQICGVRYRATGRKGHQLYRYAPGRIIAQNGTLYVQGYRLAENSLLKERPTTFLLHRIAELSPTGEYFRFDAADSEARRFGLNWHEPRPVQVRIASQAADYVRDRIWSDDQIIEEHADGGLTLTVTTTSEKEFNAWVWSFGDLAKRIDEFAPEGDDDA